MSVLIIVNLRPSDQQLVILFFCRVRRFYACCPGNTVFVLTGRPTSSRAVNANNVVIICQTPPPTTPPRKSSCRTNAWVLLLWLSLESFYSHTLSYYCCTTDIHFKSPFFLSLWSNKSDSVLTIQSGEVVWIHMLIPCVCLWVSDVCVTSF